MPAIQWRLQKLAKMDSKKRQRLIADLLKALDIEHERSGAQMSQEPGL